MHKTPVHKHMRDNLPRFKKGRKGIKCSKFHIQCQTVQQIEKYKNSNIDDDDISSNGW